MILYTIHCPNSGFTLAEVLITLGIIGIVAAMTLPSIIQKQNEKVTVTLLKKSYNVLSQALMRAVNDFGEIDNWGLQKEVGSSYSKEASRIIASNLANYIIHTDICTYGENCKNTSREQWNLTHTTKASVFANKYTYIILPDGSYYMVSSLGECTGYWDNSDACGAVYVDINGFKEPNSLGKDIFGFVFIPNGKVIPRKYNPANCNRTGTTYTNGMACTEWVLVNENMDYLYCDGLEINGKTKCK